MLTTLAVIVFAEPTWRLLLALDARRRTRPLAALLARLVGLRCGSIARPPWGDRESRCFRVAGHSQLHHNPTEGMTWATPAECRYVTARPSPIATPGPRCS